MIDGPMKVATIHFEVDELLVLLFALEAVEILPVDDCDVDDLDEKRVALHGRIQDAWKNALGC